MSAFANGIELHNGPLSMRVTALRDDVIRIRASRTNSLTEDASWAVLAEARSASVAVTHDSNATITGFHTKTLRVSVNRATGLLTLADANGNVLRQDTEPLQIHHDQFRIANAMPANEHYFGLGDKTGPLDRREQTFRLWNTDAYGWQESADPLYKSVPFYLAYRAGVSLGVLIDTRWKRVPALDFRSSGHSFSNSPRRHPTTILSTSISPTPASS